MALIVSGVVGLLGVIALAAGWAVHPQQAAFSYLTALAYFASLAVGALALTMVGLAGRARWFVPVRPVAAAVLSALPVLAAAVVPLGLALPALYPWVARPDPTQAAWLSPAFFLIRAGIYVALWLVMGEVLRHAMLHGREQRARNVSAALLPALGLSATFAAFDWMMSLEPHWYSTVYGLLWTTGGFVAAVGLVLALLRLLLPQDPHTLARLLIAFLIFWVYLAYSQGMLIWIADKPVGSSRVDLQACKLEYSIVSPK